MTGTRSLPELVRLFLRLGVTAFGGPAAHIALMEHEVVRRRQWIPRAEFLDYLGATNLIPGPNSTELAMHIGQVRAGGAGLVAAGVSFILPSAVIVAVLANGYVRYGAMPDVASVLYGIKPVAIALVLQALGGLSRTAVKGPLHLVAAVGAIIAVIFGVHELIVLVAAGLFMLVVRSGSGQGRVAAWGGLSLLAGGAATTTASAAIQAIAVPTGPLLVTLFLTLLKIGSVIFGSGYVLLAFLRADFVARLGWLTEQQLVDAIAVGQLTPGPVFTTATFIGYVVGGAAGASVATVAIFLPAFVFVALSGPLVPWMRRSSAARAALDGVNVASLALMALVSWQLGRAALVDFLAIVIMVVSLTLVTVTRVNPAWLIVGGGVVGWLTR